jgi:hypothetical protein
MRAGGFMVHQLPMCGSLSHGFFGYQPKFFHRLAKANDYEVAQLTLLCHACSPRRCSPSCAARTVANSWCRPTLRPHYSGLVPSGAPAYNVGRSSGQS